MNRTEYSGAKGVNAEDRPIPSHVAIAGHPLHPSLVPFPIAFFIAAMGTDLALMGTGDPFWYRASLWLIGAAIVMALVAATLGAWDFMSDRRLRSFQKAWYHGIGNSLIVVLAIINWWMRYSTVYGSDISNSTQTQTGDLTGTTGVVMPTTLSGTELTLSIICALAVLLTAWWGGHLVYNHMAGVTPEHPLSR